MHQFGNDPFGDPYSASSQNESNGAAGQTNNDYDPFGDTSGREINITNSTTPKNAPPVAEPPKYEEPPPSIDNEAILRKQAELDRRAEEIRRMERTMAQNAQMGVGGNQANNFPPFPECCPDPLHPCFYHDISAEIPGQFQTTVRMLFYFWVSYCVLNLFNLLFCMVLFFSGAGVGGTTFGLSIAWTLATSCCSFVCWFRPVYKAFRSDSSINFFIFFFIMFGQCCWSIFAAIGIPGTGYLGWLTAFSVGGEGVNVGFSIIGYCTAVLLTIFAVLASILLKKVHSMYRGTNASFAQAQSEFSTQVMKRGAAAGASNVASYA